MPLIALQQPTSSFEKSLTAKKTKRMRVKERMTTIKKATKGTRSEQAAQ